ncbi:putative membrane protein [Salirhabdus euzebyi]|uniref:Putative membrane protein n=1 Tax=Salirhabdus euzebyi TaxID=394506 RepID=A0A841Q980_9BACI|nr:hypothetical protein [Salirhabdus euzebyi]MBB6454817.1 putative membrane protein [Salirhabdus euzebyi]
MIKLFSVGLFLGLTIGFIGGFFTDGLFHPDFFIVSLLICYVVLFALEIRKGKTTEKPESDDLPM